jgi:hypothetical protein
MHSGGGDYWDGLPGERGEGAVLAGENGVGKGRPDRANVAGIFNGNHVGPYLMLTYQGVDGRAIFS